ncbi:MAG TPA: VOC family protein [Chloroflexota bacterium]
MTEVQTTITPMLSVRDPVQAIQFYKDAFGATEVYAHTVPDGSMYAEMVIGAASFEVTSEAAELGNLTPLALGGTPVRLSLMVPDPDAVAEQAVAAGASIIFPIADQPYGYRQGRIQDPFGHQWLIGKPLESV